VGRRVSSELSKVEEGVYKLRALEKRLLRKVSVLKKLRNLSFLICTLHMNVLRSKGLKGNVLCSKIRNVCAHEVLVVSPEGTRSRGRPRHNWEYIKMDLKEIELKWIHLFQRSGADKCKNNNEFTLSIKSGHFFSAE
jgi:hypothetical protein